MKKIPLTNLVSSCLIKQHNKPALIFTPVFDTVELGRTDMQSSFLLHLTNHGIRKGFSRLYMTSGEGDARPVPIFPVDHDNSAAITDHAHICKFNRFGSCYYVKTPSSKKQNGFTTFSAPNTFIAIRCMAFAWIRSCQIKRRRTLRSDQSSP